MFRKRKQKEYDLNAMVTFNLLKETTYSFYFPDGEMYTTKRPTEEEKQAMERVRERDIKAYRERVEGLGN